MLAGRVAGGNALRRLLKRLPEVFNRGPHAIERLPCTLAMHVNEASWKVKGNKPWILPCFHGGGGPRPPKPGDGLVGGPWQPTGGIEDESAVILFRPPALTTGRLRIRRKASHDSAPTALASLPPGGPEARGPLDRAPQKPDCGPETGCHGNSLSATIRLRLRTRSGRRNGRFIRPFLHNRDISTIERQDLEPSVCGQSGSRAA